VPWRPFLVEGRYVRDLVLAHQTLTETHHLVNLVDYVGHAIRVYRTMIALVSLITHEYDAYCVRCPENTKWGGYMFSPLPQTALCQCPSTGYRPVTASYSEVWKHAAMPLHRHTLLKHIVCPTCTASDHATGPGSHGRT